MRSRTGRKRKQSPANLPRLSKERLEELVEEAIVDAYGASEQVVGFLTLMDDNLKVPFDTEVLGVSVTVEKVDMTNDDQIVAVCARAGQKQEIPLSVKAAVEALNQKPCGFLNTIEHGLKI